MQAFWTRKLAFYANFTLAICWLNCSLLHAQPGPIGGLQIDKSRYNPGDAVQFNLDFQGTITGTQELQIQYRHLSEVVATQTIPISSNNPSWTWTPPTDDYKGYITEVVALDNSVVQGQSNIAVDVSSDWAKFPRYGFLSEYGFLSSSTMDDVIEKLNRYHINGLQFYDWASKHHQPLEGTVSNPTFNWNDIANRSNFKNTVTGYIDRAHDHNMMAMSYNLIYGANDDANAAADGVQDEWYLYKDTNHVNKDVHDLPASWKSDVYLTDPGNSAWRNYIADKTSEAFQAYNFDGWHMDQLGDRGTVYEYNSTNPVPLANEFGPFINAMMANPNLQGKRTVMNAVNQYGQSSIANSNVDFLYTEVWQPNEHFNDLASIIKTNNELSNNQLNTVLAAYMNYNLADNPGTFNAPSVLLTDAVIFAFGGSHIELGEHMLGKEYFPNNNLQMSSQLEKDLENYYDFLVGYQNLLRDGGQFTDNPLNSSNTTLTQWPAQQGNVSVVNKQVGQSEVFHLINFTDAQHLNWRDSAGTQAEPTLISNIDVNFFSHKSIQKLWAASPDDEGGSPIELNFTQTNDGIITATLPSLKYWTMLVAEAGPYTGVDDSSDPAYATSWANGSNGGSGFGPWQLSSSTTSGGFAGFWLPDDSSESNSIDNAGALDRDSGSAWSSFANKGAGIERATAFRSFDSPLGEAGDTFSVTLENGFVEGRVGVTLRNGNANATPEDFNTGARFEFYFEGGNSNYLLSDGSGVFDTGIGWTPFGLKIDFTLTGADTYDLLVWRFDQENDTTPQVFNFSGRTLAGAGNIESLALYQYDSPGTAVQSDVLFNYLSYSVADTFDISDLNQDGYVDGLDLGILLGNWGTSTTPENGELNGVSPIDGLDLGILLGSWNPPSSLTAAATVPEPKSVMLCSMLGLLGLRRR